MTGLGCDDDTRPSARNQLPNFSSTSAFRKSQTLRIFPGWPAKVNTRRMDEAKTSAE